MNTINAELIALDADTGAFCPDFGTNGRVDLKIGLGDAPDPQYVLTSAPHWLAPPSWSADVSLTTFRWICPAA